MKKLVVLFTIASFYFNVKAQDRVFSYTYQTNVLNKGQKEIEVWTTLKDGRTDYYRSLKHRLEFEVGLGRKLQTAFYLNYQYSTGIKNEDSTQILSEKTDFSFSNEWKYKISDPVANVFGSGIYFEYSISSTEIGIEGKVLFDKQIGKFITALNIVGEYTISKDFVTKDSQIEVKNSIETVNEIVYGLSYKLKDHLFVGFEAFNQNIFGKSKIDASILSVGPSFSYSTNGFWINFSFLPQVTNFVNNKLDLNGHEKFQARLLFSYEL
ncbi:MAG: hypothetical protein A2X08_16830 [Bacteroidetes bacterium GWA2_32_17]|nr:MAG: hypothetical protein A2X08_16830 [Bacteroidetes bacterium GWA2_32_17]